METMKEERSIVRLLQATVALLSVLVFVLAGGAGWAFYQYDQVRQSLQSSTGNDLTSLRDAMEKTVTAAEEITVRQGALAQALDTRADQTSTEINALQQRRSALGELRPGPIQKLTQTLEMNQLMADELLLLLRHLNSTQSSLAKSMRPLPTQRQALTPKRRR